MLRRLHLRDVVLVTELELDFSGGFAVLTGETGAGKSILIDALQLALGQRAESTLVREGAARCEVAAEFDTPPGLAPWLEAQGFHSPDEPGLLLLRRQVEPQGKSRGWINGSPATAAQLREAAEWLVDIHGQHAWQSLTRPVAVRALLDAQAGSDIASLQKAWQHWREAAAKLEAARAQQDSLARERERLQWQLGEVEKLAPRENEWEAINAEHQRLAHGQALLEGARAALVALSEGEPGADALLSRASEALGSVIRFDAQLGDLLQEVQAAQAQVRDASHTLQSYLARTEPDPQRLDELDTRMGAWMSLARRYKRTPAELPALWQQWQQELTGLDAAADVPRLQALEESAGALWKETAAKVSKARAKAAPKLAKDITAAMQQLGMPGGRFEVALVTEPFPQAHGLETVEFRVAGHAGSTPRALGKVASGGELSRLALAIATTTSRNTVQANANGAAGTLIFDEIDAGVGGAVADSVGRLMKQLGQHAQVLAVTHLAQVAACADQHLVVSKATEAGRTRSQVTPVSGEARVLEVARMLGGERLTNTSRAHAQALLGGQP
jgi:DNA repair protein RecN (Recombination protein N)